MYHNEDKHDNTEPNNTYVEFDEIPLALTNSRIDRRTAHEIHLSPLSWHHLEDFPIKMKITNREETVVVSGKWNKNQRPFVTGGPFVGDYVFSHLHFHWSELEVSENILPIVTHPMEMHVVMFKRCYSTTEAALKHVNGVVIFNYHVKLSNMSSPGLEKWAEKLGSILQPKTHVMLDPTPLSTILVPTTKDYFVSWDALGSIYTIMWIVPGVNLDISAEDLEKFRELKNPRLNISLQKPSLQLEKVIFHVNPSTNFLGRNVMANNNVHMTALDSKLHDKSTPQLKNDYVDSSLVKSGFKGTETSLKTITFPRKRNNTDRQKDVNKGNTFCCNVSKRSSKSRRR